MAKLAETRVTLTAQEAAHLVDDVRRQIAGLKVLKELADEGDINAKELLRQYHEVLSTTRPSIVLL